MYEKRPGGHKCYSIFPENKTRFKCVWRQRYCAARISHVSNSTKKERPIRDALSKGSLNVHSNLFFFKHVLFGVTHRTNPFLRQFGKRGTWSDAVLFISYGGVVHISANSTNIPIQLHFLRFFQETFLYYSPKYSFSLATSTSTSSP